MSQFSLLHYLPQCSFSLAQFLVFYDCRRSPSLRVGAAIFLPFHKVSAILGSFILFAAIILLLNFFGAILFLLRRFPSFFSVIMGAAISLYFHNACAIFLSFILFSAILLLLCLSCRNSFAPFCLSCCKSFAPSFYLSQIFNLSLTSPHLFSL